MSKFEEQCDKLGKFCAIRSICEEANSIMRAHNGHMLASEALIWAAYDKQPDNYKAITHAIELENFLERNPIELDGVYGSLRAAALESFKKSKQAKHRIYDYTLLEDPNDASRLRILVNMMWLRYVNNK